MKRRIIAYMNYIDDILSDSEQNYDYESIIKQHLIQLDFFMHERLVHLLVTLTFALLAFGTFFLLYQSFSPALLLLLFVIFILLVPYIMHYFLLENGVQKMYRQYDELVIKAGNVKMSFCVDKTDFKRNN